MMTRKYLFTALIGSLVLPALAAADPIIEVYGSGGSAPDPLGGYTMTSFDEPADTAGTVTSASSPLGGDVLFMQQGATDPLPMSVDDPNWWIGNHGNVYTTNVHWIELIMPANTRAFSFFVGAEFRGSGWVEAYDSDGNSSYQAFNVSPDSTPGFGVYSPDSCAAITRIIVEPQDWGIGNFAINQDPCVQVPEPAPITLFGIGLLALAASRRFLKPVTLR